MVFTKLLLENALSIWPCNYDAASESLLPKVAHCIPVLSSRYVEKVRRPCFEALWWYWYNKLIINVQLTDVLHVLKETFKAENAYTPTLILAKKCQCVATEFASNSYHRAPKPPCSATKITGHTKNSFCINTTKYWFVQYSKKSSLPNFYFIRSWFYDQSLPPYEIVSVSTHPHERYLVYV